MKKVGAVEQLHHAAMHKGTKQDGLHTCTIKLAMFAMLHNNKGTVMRREHNKRQTQREGKNQPKVGNNITSFVDLVCAMMMSARVSRATWAT
jgi:hypothetical protein